MPPGKDALQEVIAERMAKQGNKSIKQLYADMAAKRSKKVSNFDDWKRIEKVDLSYIPGREKRKEDSRTKALRIRKKKEEDERKRKAKSDWTPTDEFGNIDMSVEAQVLELVGLPDPSTDNRVGPIYPRGKRIEALTLGVPLDHSNSHTFEILQPKRRADYNPDESHRHRLAKLKDAPKLFELEENKSDVAVVNASTGTINERCLYINYVAISEDDVYKLGRALHRSTEPKVLDLYGNFVQDGPAVFLTERLADGAKLQVEGGEASLHTISWNSNTLGPALYSSVAALLNVTQSLTALNLSSAFDPISDEEGAILMKGLVQNDTLVHLNLTGNTLSKSFAWELRAALLVHTRLECLTLDCNQITDDAAFFVAEALGKNKRNNLRRLSLAWNFVDHEGFGALMDACGKEHNKMQIIDLSHNRISKCSSGSVTASLGQCETLQALNLSYNRIADVTEIGLGLYFNATLEDLDLSHNLIADNTMQWFAVWGREKANLRSSALRSMDLRQNKLGDAAAGCLLQGLKRRSAIRTLVNMNVSDNLMDPLLAEAIGVLLTPSKAFERNKIQAMKLIKQKKANDKAYWKERKWEALQKKRKEALDEAVRRLNTRNEDEVELDVIIGGTLASRIPIVRTIASYANQWQYGTKPSWQIQAELIQEQKRKAAIDITFRKSLVKGINK